MAFHVRDGPKLEAIIESIVAGKLERLTSTCFNLKPAFSSMSKWVDVLAKVSDNLNVTRRLLQEILGLWHRNSAVAAVTTAMLIGGTTPAA
jgi:hypothetical protein